MDTKTEEYPFLFPTPSNEYAIYHIYLNGYPLFYFYDKRQLNYKYAIIKWFECHHDSLYKMMKDIALRKHNFNLDKLSLKENIYRMSIVNNVTNHFGDKVNVGCYHIDLLTKDNDNNSTFIPLIVLKDISAKLSQNYLLFKF